MGNDFLTANKVAAKLGLPQKTVKQYIETNEVHPDKVKGNCKYYGQETVEKIEKDCCCEGCKKE